MRGTLRESVARASFPVERKSKTRSVRPSVICSRGVVHLFQRGTGEGRIELGNTAPDRRWVNPGRPCLDLPVSLCFLKRMVAPIIPAANTVKPGTKFKPSARAAASKDRLDG